MPELPELQALAEGLDAAVTGRRIVRAVAHSPAVVRSAAPPLEALEGHLITAVRRRGKHMLVEAGDLTLVLHLMSAGRLGLTTAAGPRPPRSASLGLVLARGEDDAGGDPPAAEELRLRENSRTRRANAYLVPTAELDAHGPLARLGPEPGELDAAGWRARLTDPPGVLQTALREGRRVAGVGRCYASELMWAARLPPLARTDRLDDDAWQRLARAAEVVLGGATARARERITTNLPDAEKRTTAVHGHHGEPCLRCGTRLERIGFQDYELVYCPRCQTGGRVYADRRTSRFLR
ncbi:MAG TPA: DNA-formamidopyrimidine glycosylase family protein [Miltoncostaeaceae bacterium]|nr:DNA-formamidopyrimidine glycosylase family protein [Miltoncostaeaceae bacterium]